MSGERTYDVVSLTDGRFTGGTSASLAEEIVAQSRAGYTTGLVHWPSAMISKAMPLNPRLRRCLREGHAELVVGPEPVRCRLLLARHPSTFANPPEGLPPIEAEQALLVANQAPRDDSEPEPFYDVAQVHAHITEAVGREVAWAPIGPLVRRVLEAEPTVPPMEPDDWVNVLDPDQWAVARPGPRGDRPIIGRHSRPSFRKWPEDRDTLLACYPDDGSADVRVLGGAEAPAQVLGRQPRTWRVTGFNRVGVRRFLSGIDFFVYYHHSGWVESFGRAIIEALATGAVGVLPEHFRELFGDGALYRRPEEVLATLRELHGDAEAFRERSEAGRQMVADRYSHRAHVDRVRERIGAPSAQPATPSAPLPAPGTRPRVLLVSSNGSGVGHLMRTLSMARRLERVQPVVLTMSQGVAVARMLGVAAEHLAHGSYSGLTSKEWSGLLRSRLRDLVAAHRPAAMLFDGTRPYPGMVHFHDDHPEVPLVWSRRGMWKPGSATVAFEREWIFQRVVEPGDLAGDLDAGPTAERRAKDPGSVRVLDPVVLLRRDELVARQAARDELGLPDDRPVALVQLGAGNINDLGPTLQAVIEALGREGLGICLTRSAIAEQAAEVADHVRTVSVYPLMRYLRAFDLAVAAPGYNTFHEAICAGLPTLWIPNRETDVDDQGGRAAWAVREGVGLAAEADDAGGIAEAVRRLGDVDQREALRKAAERVWPDGDGAAQAVETLAELVGVGP